MRKILFTSLVCFLLVQCTSTTTHVNEKMVESDTQEPKDTFHLLCQYWILEDADNPLPGDVPFKDENGIQYQPGIVFITDSVILENPVGKMEYGKFRLDSNTVSVVYDNGIKANYEITRLHKDELWMKRMEKKKISQLKYKASFTYWPDASKNPFSKQNYQWVIKPRKPEYETEIKDRAKEMVQFYADYFQGFVNGGATVIDFGDLPGCFKWYQGGIFIQSENKLDKKWINCFYSEDQALQARQMLEDAPQKKYDWDTTETDWVKQTAKVLQQIHDRM